MSAVGSLSPFVNEPFLDFTVPANAEAMRAAIAAVRGQLGVSYELLIGGKAVATGKTFASTNPAKPAEVIGVHAEASEADALAAIEAAQTAFATWSKTCRWKSG
jgi:1-pyrroline-5-carboxylate dehydrogenase